MEAEVFRKLWADFLPYQVKYIKDQSRLVGVEKAVRTGFTYCHAFKKALKWTFPRTDPRTGQQVKTMGREIFVSKNLKTAAEYLNYHKTWARALNLIFGDEVIKTSNWTTEIARYPHGNVEIYSSDPDAFRGLRGDVTLDEFAFHDQQDALYSTAQGRMMWEPDGQVSLISSHSHPETTFCRLMTESKIGRNKFSRHCVTLEDAVAEGLAMKVPGDHLNLWDAKKPAESRKKIDAEFLIRIRAQCLDDDQYMREYMCEPSGLGSLITGNEYDKLYEYDESGQTIIVPDFIPEYVRGDLYIGIDVGRARDLTVIWALERGMNPNADAGEQEVFRTCAVRALFNTSFPDQQKVIAEFLRHPLVTNCCIDAGGIGSILCEALRDEHGSMVEPFALGGNRKGELCERVKRFVQSERVTLPHDGDIRSDLIAMRKEATKAGHIRYEGKTNKTHCDYFIALALALNAAATELRLDMAGRGNVTGPASAPALPNLSSTR
jgi:phage FluMu gp28-like protein